MIQEVITYCIVALAVIMAFLKIYKVMFGKKRGRLENLKDHIITPQIHCSDCNAECILRETTILKEPDADLCKTSNQNIKGS